MTLQTASILDKKTWIYIVGALGLSIMTGLFTLFHASTVITFFIAAAALALIAALVGEATDQLGGRLGAGATGVLQSALGNLPELFVAIFSLQAGLVTVVQSALVGSILGNSLLVLGLAFFCGGLRHGTQHFNSQSTGMITTLSLLSVAALIIPTVVQELHTPAAGHEEEIGIFCAVVLLVIFIASIPSSIKQGQKPAKEQEQESPIPTIKPVADEAPWPLWLTILILAVAAVGAALVSDWFVEALQPAISILHISESFTGLIIVAIAGNAVEHAVGVQFALRNQMDFANSVILNSSLQIALLLTPLLILISLFMGGAHLTLVFPPLLVVALLLTALITPLILYDGRSNWLEGLTLIGLYLIIAVSVWWG